MHTAATVGNEFDEVMHLTGAVEGYFGLIYDSSNKLEPVRTAQIDRQTFEHFRAARQHRERVSA